MGLSIELCTEISVPLKKGGHVGEGSGYTLGPGWVLTAHHVLFGDDVKEHANAKITIVWRKAPELASGKPPSVKVRRKAIAWAHPELDLALIRCP